MQDAQTHPMDPVSPGGAAPTQPISPARPDTIYARAAVRVPATPLRQPTDEYPLVDDPRQHPAHPHIPGFRQPNPGTRRLSLGWGWSFTGYLLMFIGWGVWAASVRGEMVIPLIDLGIVTVVAIGLFAVCRLFGRVVWEGTFNRPRRSARLAHALTGLFLTAAGIGFLAHTVWIADAITWIKTNF